MKYILKYQIFNENFTKLNKVEFIEKIEKLKNLFYDEIIKQQIRVNGNISVHVQFVTDKKISIIFKALYTTNVYGALEWFDNDKIILYSNNHTKEYNGEIESLVPEIISQIAEFNSI
jgi:hypothetical protein